LGIYLRWEGIASARAGRKAEAAEARENFKRLDKGGVQGGFIGEGNQRFAVRASEGKTICVALRMQKLRLEGIASGIWNPLFLGCDKYWACESARAGIVAQGAPALAVRLCANSEKTLNLGRRLGHTGFQRRFHCVGGATFSDWITTLRC